MRLFIAIPLDSTIQQKLSVFADSLKPEIENAVRWVKPSHIHLTVKFLGEVDAIKLAPLKSEMLRIAGEFHPLELTLQGCGVFPNWKQPRVIWVGVQSPDPLAELVIELESHLSDLGFPAESRAFSPHLTLGRINNGLTPAQTDKLRSKMEAARGRVFASMQAENLTLFRSELRPAGPIYTEIFQARFRPLGDNMIES